MRILFDLDGTLTNPFLGITTSIQFALEKLGQDVPLAKDLSWCIGPVLSESFASLLKTTDQEMIAEAMKFYRERYGTVGLFENEVYTGITQSLQTLKDQGHSLSVATSKPRVFARRIIEHFGLEQYFCAVDGCELDGTRGDKSSLIAYVLERDRLDSAQVLMIGDRKYDILGASENQVRGIGVLWGFGSKEELCTAGALSCTDKPEDLPQMVVDLFGE